jgi:hypothetical protein
MTCPRIIRAIKSSRLPAPLKHTLTVMTDHINSWKDPTTGVADHTRPATLEVYDAVATLAADTGYSKPTVMMHLWKLRGFTPVPGHPKKTWPQDGPWAVLTRTKKGRQWQADRYQLDLEALEALADLTRVQTPTRDRQRSRNFTAELAPAVKFSTFSGQETLPEYSLSLPTTTEIPFLSESDPEPTTPKKNGEDRSRIQANSKTTTPAPDTFDLTDELRAWVHAHARQVDLVFEREKFLQHCRAHAIENINWIEAFKLWLLEAHRRATRHGHRPEIGPDPVVAQLRATRAAEAPVDPPLDLVPPPTPAAEAAPPRPLAHCDWAYGCAQAPCPHGSRCASHAGCAACFAAQHAATTHTGPPHPLGSDTGPPPEASAFHQRHVVQEATAHRLTGLSALMAAVVQSSPQHPLHQCGVNSTLPAIP